MTYGEWGARVWCLCGGRNVDCTDGNGEVLILSQVARGNPIYYLLNVLVGSTIILCLVVGGVECLNGEATAVGIMKKAAAIGGMLIAYLTLRIREGDTILVTERGIRECNWVRTKRIDWDEVECVYIYGWMENARHLCGGWLDRLVWTELRVGGRRVSIRLTNRYGGYDRVRQYLERRCREKVRVRSVDVVDLTIGLLGMGAGLLGIAYAAQLRLWLQR